MELPTVRQLECFIAVSETLHFRKAAESLYVTQPALSTQIRALETLLGVRLFERDRRTVLPTAAGEVLSGKARGILADLRDLTEAAATLGLPLSGTIRLGVIPTVAPYVLPRAVGEVRRRYPDLQLLLKEGKTDDLMEMLRAGSLDLAMVAREAELGDAETLTLFEDRFLLAVPTEHRLAKRKRVREDDLSGEQVLLLDDGHCLRDQALPICGRGGACEFGDFRASSLTTLVQMVSSGVGITLLPEVAVEVETGADRPLSLIPFRADGPSRTICLVWRPSTVRKTEFRLLGEAIRDGAARSPSAVSRSTSS